MECKSLYNSSLSSLVIYSLSINIISDIGLQFQEIRKVIIKNNVIIVISVKKRKERI